jgi:hypothetical protein
VDLAYLAREHHAYISPESVADLVVKKFNKEKHAERYRLASIERPAQLVAAFTRPSKLRDLRNDWARFSTTELFVLPGERSGPQHLTLVKVDNVERQAIEFWQTTLDLLR